MFAYLFIGYLLNTAPYTWTCTRCPLLKLYWYGVVKFWSSDWFAKTS